MNMKKMKTNITIIVFKNIEIELMDKINFLLLKKTNLIMFFFDTLISCLIFFVYKTALLFFEIYNIKKNFISCESMHALYESLSICYCYFIINL